MNEFYLKVVSKIVIANFFISYIGVAELWSVGPDLNYIRYIIIFSIIVAVLIVFNRNIIKKRKKEVKDFSTKMYVIFVVILPSITPMIMYIMYIIIKELLELLNYCAVPV